MPGWQDSGALQLTLKALNQLNLRTEEKLCAVLLELCQHECSLRLTLVFRLSHA